MALVQDTDITSVDYTGQTLDAHLLIANGTVTLNYVITPANVSIAQEQADVGTGAATTLLSYFDTSAGTLSASGETHAATLSTRFGGTIDTYFS
ncbi:MAG TPA: hypothetical protein DDW52_10250 [Planctomycetaceae bacterium]|nr:hypothetical protein [Planctomycetaceae bacterium]